RAGGVQDVPGQEGRVHQGRAQAVTPALWFWFFTRDCGERIRVEGHVQGGIGRGRVLRRAQCARERRDEDARGRGLRSGAADALYRPFYLVAGLGLLALLVLCSRSTWG